MKKILLATLSILIISGGFLFSGRALADQASLSLSPISGGPFSVGQSFPISVWAKTGGAKIDTIRASLTFPADLLDVQTVSSSSTYPMSSGGNAFNNSAGTIYWGAGAPGGTTSDASFITITFRAKAEGTAIVALASNSYMLSAGQSIPFVKTNGSYTVQSAAPSAPTPPQPGYAPPIPAKNSLQQIAPATLSIINEVNEIPRSTDGFAMVSGRTGVGGANISIIIDNGLVAESITADENGDWQWRSPTKIGPGSYNVEIGASHPQDASVSVKTIKTLEVVITEAMESLFDVLLDIDKSTRNILPGEKLKLGIKTINFGDEVKESTIVTASFIYTIENSNRKEVLRINESRKIVGRESAFSKEIILPKSISPGQYFITAKMTYGKTQEASSSESFRVKKPSFASELANNPVAIAITTIAALLVIILYASWKKKRALKKLTTSGSKRTRG